MTEHNENHDAAEATAAPKNAQRAMSYITRVENLDREARELREAKKDVFAEAKSAGFNPKILKKIISIRKLDPSTRRAEEDELETFMVMLGLD